PGDGVGEATTGYTTWGADGRYLFEISDADGLAGTDSDLWNIDGNLSITSQAFTIAVATLDEASSGQMADFDNSQAYSWLIASTSGTIFGGTDLRLDLSLFENATRGIFGFSETGDNSLYLTYIPCIFGDADGSGTVDEGDAAILANHWGLAGDWGMGDFNLDGMINAADAAILAANWGHVADYESAPVPEPSMFALLLAATMAIVGSRARIKS
ncbi:MAG: hypothetical protein JW719_00015, partial [Pirellulales bacterium]|nr:hypothetical protein [Pirellulales bacterium]